MQVYLVFTACWHGVARCSSDTVWHSLCVFNVVRSRFRGQSRGRFLSARRGGPSRLWSGRGDLALSTGPGLGLAHGPDLCPGPGPCPDLDLSLYRRRDPCVDRSSDTTVLISYRLVSPLLPLCSLSPLPW